MIFCTLGMPTLDTLRFANFIVIPFALYIGLALARHFG